MMQQFESVKIEQVFSPGDLLLHAPSAKFQHRAYKMIWKMFPRRVMSRMARRWGLFLLITVRALLPLNVSPEVSVMITFALLGCLGWAGAARVICADARALSQSDFILLARASGSGGFRLLWRHLVPNLKPVLYAQFWISVPVFILTEANLGILGLGVAEPLPSWGSLLRELESFSTISLQAWQFVPLLLFIATVSSFHLVLTKEELAA
jgi:ABC-type dipeptide/oligopeptide/nickel transport system permease subunit